LNILTGTHILEAQVLMDKSLARPRMTPETARVLKGQFGNMRAIIKREQHRLVDSGDIEYVETLSTILIELDYLEGYIFPFDVHDVQL